jgi:hypothetical protein
MRVNHDRAYAELLVAEQLGRKEEARLAELLGLENRIEQSR